MNIPKNTQTEFILISNKNYKLSYLKSLYTICVLLGISPFYNFQLNRETNNKLLRIFPCLSLISTTGSYIYFLNKFIKLVLPNNRFTNTIVDALLYSGLTILNLLSVFSNLIYKKKWLELLKILNKLDQGIAETKSPVNFIKVWIIIIICVTGLVCLITYETWAYTKIDGITFVDFYSIERIQYLFILFFVLQSSAFAILIKNKLQIFNNCLYRESSAVRLTKGLNSKQCSFRKATDTFFQIDKMFNLFNEIFGWQIVVLMGVLVLALLESINASMNYKSGKEEVVSSTVLFGIVTLLWGILVIFCCDTANREAHRTATICYQLLTELPDNSPEMDKLLYLAQHAAHRCPQITAANVFVVNINALFGIMGSLTSYVIVLISFNNSPSQGTATSTSTPLNLTMSSVTKP